jgi:hypothetical protein
MKLARLLVIAALVGCPASTKTPPPSPSPSPSPVTPAPLSGVPRADANRIAAELALPLFWIADTDGDEVLDAGELAVLWGVADTRRGEWLEGEAPTALLADAWRRIVERHQKGPQGGDLPAPEARRRELVLKELGQGVPTLLHSDFRKAPAADRALVDHVARAARIVERIHARQLGSFGLAEQVPADDPASRMLFYRNQGPWCVAPATEKERECNAVPSLPPKVSGLYPAALQSQPGFCDALSKRPDAEALRHQFNVVAGDGNELKAVPYSEAYAADAKLVAEELRAAAAALGDDEAALKAYLIAAAKAFGDNGWEAADEAWAAMNGRNSKWYLRIGPDEVYFEPCSLKAGFHVSFARINEASLAWQQKLDPVKKEMEQVVAKLAGPPYAAREVAFHLPDFIDVVLNAGDSRDPHGGTIGQSLPNWGKVADESRGRTVVMTNLYTDADSKASMVAQASSLLCSATMAKFSPEPEPLVMSTVLHEAMHNLGPSHDYKVEGKKATDVFGGPMASILEELKAQTGALFFTDWLRDKGLVAADLAERAHVRDVVWAFGHVSRGMYTGDGHPKAYSQLAAIQLGFLRERGAVEWRADEMAPNGSDKGCLIIHADKMQAPIVELMKEVAGIKSRGDKARAEALKKAYVDVDGDKKLLLDTIRERWLRAPKASFVYGVDL